MVDFKNHLTTLEIADILYISKWRVCNYLRTLGFVLKVNVWIPHKLTKAKFLQKIPPLISCLSEKKKNRFFLNVITGDKKSILYNKQSENNYNNNQTTTIKNV